MYIGGWQHGPPPPCWEILDNAIDEAMNGTPRAIRRHAPRDGSSDDDHDDGRGDSRVDKHPQSKEERARGGVHRSPTRAESSSPAATRRPAACTGRRQRRLRAVEETRRHREA